MQHLISKKRRYRNSISRRAFTLVEIMVALAVFMLLLVIILVPLSMGMNLLHLGMAQADVRNTAQRVVNRMQGDLTRAIYVYPNDLLPSVTNQAPYNHYAPYLRTNLCFPSTTPYVSNLSRIDMLLPQTAEDGSVLTPLVPTYYIVTYYTRRRDIGKDYHPIDNPIVLYRAQIPFRGDPTNPTALINVSGEAVAPAPSGDPYPPSPTSAFNANVYSSRLDKSACSTASIALERSALWLKQSMDGEPNLQPLTDPDDTTAHPSGADASLFALYASHTSLIPIDMGMTTNVNYKGYDSHNNLVTTYTPPESTFACSDINQDGIIDHVKLSISLQKVDAAGAQPKGQEITLSQAVNLPNVTALPGIR